MIILYLFQLVFIGEVPDWLKRAYFFLFFFSSGENDPANKQKLVQNSNRTLEKCEICSKLTMKTPERRH